MDHLAFKILNNKLAGAGVRISMPNDMYIEGLQDSPEFFRFYTSDDREKNTIEIGVLLYESIEHWRSFDHSFSIGMDSVSEEIPFIINGIPGIATYAYGKPGKKYVDHIRTGENGEPEKVFAVDPRHSIGFNILFAADADTEEFLSVIIYWHANTFPSNDYIACADELLKEKNIAEMLNSIERV